MKNEKEMLSLHHFDDGKGKYQSHEINLVEDYTYITNEKWSCGISSLNPFDICGYGETKEAAEKEFKEKFNFVIDKLIEFRDKINKK